jgi:superfamily II DNA/RNA helicase
MSACLQVMAFSATFTPELLADVEPLMKRPQKVMLCESEERVSLKGVRQFYQILGDQGQKEVRPESEYLGCDTLHAVLIERLCCRQAA